MRIFRRDVVNVKTCLCVNYQLFLSDFNETRNFPIGFREILIPNVMKILLAGDLFYADGRTDEHDETNCHCLQFCERA